jgi:ribosome biogenesis GTPase
MGKHSPKIPQKCQHQGRVVTRYGAELIIQNSADAAHIRCTARRKFDNLACGDYVCWQSSKQGNAIVTALLPRKNALMRPDHRHKPKAIAANIEQIIIICSWLPKPSWMLVDQYLIAAQQMGAEAIIVVNKADLATPHSQQKDWQALEDYAAIGYSVIHSQATTGEGIEAIQSHLADKTSIFVGQSGVGKSSIIQYVLPNTVIKVGDISHSGEGKHTTTTADLYKASDNAYVIDSPGVRDFMLSEINAEIIRSGYQEFAEHALHCRFNNCSHTHEPHCYVKQAAEKNIISTGRYRRYLAKLSLLD